MSLQTTIYNERLKLTANLLNSVASWLLTAGGIGSTLTLVTNAAAPVGFGSLLALTGIFLTLGLALHLLARRLLGMLQQ